MALTLKNLWFNSLYWLEFFHQDLHRQLFSLINAFLFWNQLLYIHSIISAPLWWKPSQCTCASCFFFKKIPLNSKNKVKRIIRTFHPHFLLWRKLLPRKIKCAKAVKIKFLESIRIHIYTPFTIKFISKMSIFQKFVSRFE